MQVVPYFCALYKKCYNFQSGKLSNPYLFTRTCYTKHSNPHFHTKHRLNQLPHEYINTWFPLATLSVHTLKLPPSHGPIHHYGTSPLWWLSSAQLEGGYFYLSHNVNIHKFWAQNIEEVSMWLNNGTFREFILSSTFAMTDHVLRLRFKVAS